MATEKQVAFFQSLYDIERERTASLRETAKNYVSLSSLYSAFIIFVTEKLQPTSVITKSLFGAAIITMLLAFLAALLVTQVATFEALTDPDEVINQFGVEPPTDADFFDNRIADYSVATQRNRIVNERKARYLAVAGYLILAGLAIHAAYFLDWLVNKKGFSSGAQ